MALENPLAQKQEFLILCDSLRLIIDSYNDRHYMPDWLFKFWHPRGRQVSVVKRQITHIKLAAKPEDDYHESVNKLIRTLDKQRYKLSVHVESKRLRSKVLDSLIACLFFSQEDINNYEELVVKQQQVSEYLIHLEQNEKLEVYREYYKRQHAVFGRRIERFTDAEITLAAKEGMINGKLIDRYGIPAMIEYGFSYVRKELETIQRHHAYAGFLTSFVLEGFFEKIKLINESSQNPACDQAALVQNARYLLENITNAAGVLASGEAMHDQHEELVAGCFWVDELFREAKARFDAA